MKCDCCGKEITEGETCSIFPSKVFHPGCPKITKEIQYYRDTILSLRQEISEYKEILEGLENDL